MFIDSIYFINTDYEKFLSYVKIFYKAAMLDNSFTVIWVYFHIFKTGNINMCTFFILKISEDNNKGTSFNIFKFLKTFIKHNIVYVNSFGTDFFSIKKSTFTL